MSLIIHILVNHAYCNTQFLVVQADKEYFFLQLDLNCFSQAAPLHWVDCNSLLVFVFEGKQQIY